MTTRLHRRSFLLLLGAVAAPAGALAQVTGVTPPPPTGRWIAEMDSGASADPVGVGPTGVTDRDARDRARFGLGRMTDADRTDPRERGRGPASTRRTGLQDTDPGDLNWYGRGGPRNRPHVVPPPSPINDRDKCPDNDHLGVACPGNRYVGTGRRRRP